MSRATLTALTHFVRISQLDLGITYRDSVGLNIDSSQIRYAQPGKKGQKEGSKFTRIKKKNGKKKIEDKRREDGWRGRVTRNNPETNKANAKTNKRNANNGVDMNSLRLGSARGREKRKPANRT